MAPAADRRRDFDARSHREIVRVSRVPGRRAMAVFALHTGELRSCGFADEPSRQPETDGVARQTRTVRLAALSHEQPLVKAPAWEVFITW